MQACRRPRRWRIRPRCAFDHGAPQSVAWVGAVAALMLATVASAPAQETRSAQGAMLLRDAGLPGDVDPMLAGPQAVAPGVARARQVQVDQNVLDTLALEVNGVLRMQLFDDVGFDVKLEPQGRLSPDATVWSGRIIGLPASLVTLVQSGGVYAGSVYAPGRGRFDLRPLAGGAHIVRELNDHPLRQCGGGHAPAALEPQPGPLGITAPRPAGAPAFGGSAAAQSGPAAAYACDDGTVIDLMVVYTAAARTAAGGQSAIHALIDLAIADTNAAFVRSEIDTSIRLVHRQEVDYTETGNWTIDGPRLVGTDDGHLDEVHPWRDIHGADCVSLWVNNLNAGGIGYFPHPSHEGVGASGFTIMRQDNAAGLTLAHELGHNLWCAHDRANAPDPPFDDRYSYGYREPGAAWHTIMAYPPGELIPYFANPNVNWPGPVPPNPGPTGKSLPAPDACDIALTIQQTRHIVANFRPALIPGLPTRLYVKATASPGGDGLSWATAFQDLQDALCRAAGSGGAVQEIWVAAGTYRPDRGGGDRWASFRLQEGLALYGGFPASGNPELPDRDPGVQITILSGDIGAGGDPSDNSYHVVKATGVDHTAILDGFRITGGIANGAFPENGGGGASIDAASPTFNQCHLVDNRADYGAALEIVDGSEPAFTECTIESNVAVILGGGAQLHASSPAFTGCQFIGNSADVGGAMHIESGSEPFLNGCTFLNNSANWSGAVKNYVVSPVFTDCHFESNTSVNGGGAMENGEGSSPTLIGCTFLDNAAAFGGGVYNYNHSNPILVDCDFISNAAYGGGMYNYNASPTLWQCTFVENDAGEGGSGGALWNALGSSPLISDCTFEGNTAGFGAAAVGNDASTPRIRRCTFIDNTAYTAAGVWNTNGSPAVLVSCRFLGNTVEDAGGAVRNDASSPLLVNCGFSGNQATNGHGGAFANYGGSDTTRIINCTFALNSASGAGGGMSNDSAAPVITNTIFWGNTDGWSANAQSEQIYLWAGSPVVDYCVVQGLTGSLGGMGNSGANPNLADANGLDDIAGTLDDDLRPAAGPPVLDAGDTAAVPADTADLDADNDTGEPTPHDLDGHPRVLAAAVEIGAYEIVPAHPVDFDGDGDVDQDDFGHFQVCATGPELGPPGTGCDNADLDGDDDVDQSDFGVFQRCISGPAQAADPACAD
ncbi:MAG: hypothetical protein AMXMBFR13_39220 [Phycisphaerae bacterium]